MASDTLNNNDRSPCLVCPHRDMDKNKCSLLCLRLAAYNSGEPWGRKPLPYIAKGNQVTPSAMPVKEEKETMKMEEAEIRNQRSEVEDQGPAKNENSPLERGGREADGVCESSDNQQPKACVICHDPDKKILNKRSQTCGACYQAWNTGKINHPTLGKFKPPLTKSKITKTKKTEPACRKSGGVKGPPVKKKFEALQGKFDYSKPVAGFILNLDKFQKIKTAVYDTAEKYFVTPEHVVINLLGEALAGREGK